MPIDLEEVEDLERSRQPWGRVRCNGALSVFTSYKSDKSKNNFQTGVMSSDSIYEMLTSNGLRRT